MAGPNTLIFVDLASDDAEAAGKFYEEVFGWRNDHRPTGIYHRMVPGGQFKNPDGSDSEIGNLHLNPVKVVADVGEIPAADAIIFAVKMRDTESAAESLKPLVAKGAAVFTFQNGVESAERIGKIVGEGNVVEGAARIASNIPEPGVIKHIYGDQFGLGARTHDLGIEPGTGVSATKRNRSTREVPVALDAGAGRADLPHAGTERLDRLVPQRRVRCREQFDDRDDQRVDVG